MKRIVVGSQLQQIVREDSISRATRAKWTGGVAQVVDHLICKCKALSSNPSLTKKKKEKEKKKETQQYLYHGEVLLNLLILEYTVFISYFSLLGSKGLNLIEKKISHAYGSHSLASFKLPNEAI
jgi:hypothetical protein